jgi:DNA-binding NtrC family response regulator
LDDVRSAFRRAEPDIVILTGSLRERPAAELAALARARAAGTLGLLERAEHDPPRLAHDVGLTAWMQKPVTPGDVVAAVQRLLERRRLQERTGILGESPAVQEVLVKIEQMAPVSSTVLIEGESGTGKELVAQAIHHLSARREKPFIAVNCAALPETLLESELFGHEKGSFTGAAERRLGRFELANGGTLFLDEVGEMPPAVQVKLLRVLETRSFFRVGGAQPIRVDVRVVAASNRPLKEAVALGEFRDDLFYRLNVLSIYLPPLRERRADIPILVRRFVQDLSRQHGRTFRGISAEAMEILMRAPWPGNVRQLRNLVESMVVLAPGREIGPGDIPPEIREGGARLLPVRLPDESRDISGRELEFIFRSLVDLKVQIEDLRRRIDEAAHPVEVIDVARSAPVYAGPLGPSARGRDDNHDEEPDAVLYRPGMTMTDVEKATIEVALQDTHGNRRKAAERLGIGERTLYRKIKEYGLT